MDSSSVAYVPRSNALRYLIRRWNTTRARGDDWFEATEAVPWGPPRASRSAGAGFQPDDRTLVGRADDVSFGARHRAPL